MAGSKWVRLIRGVHELKLTNILYVLFLLALREMRPKKEPAYIQKSSSPNRKKASSYG